MFNFSSMFNTSRGPQSASITELLSLPNVSLMRLLDQDTFLSQFRSASQPIRQFMNYQRFQQMIELVTQVGDPFDKKRSYKFPLTAAELLSSQSSLVFEKLIPDEGVVVEEEKVVTQEVKESQQEMEIDDDDEDEEEEREEEKKQGEEGKAVTEQVEQVSTEEAKEAVAAAQGQEEQFGDFVGPVKRTKKVIVKEVVEKVTILKKQYPPLVESLLAYFSKQLNYTLTSYCCRILTSILNKRTAKFLAKFFQSETHGENLLKHIGSRSVVQLITRIFTIETKELLDRRLGYFQRVLKALGQPQEIEVTSNLSAALCESLEKLSAHLKAANPCAELKAYFNSVPELLVIAVNNLVGEHQAAALYSAPLIAQLLAVLPSELDDFSVDTALAIFVEAALSRLAEAITAKETRLGVGRTKMLEILNVIAKRPAVKTLLADHQGFLPLLFSLVKTYPLNNILHNQAFKLISSFLPSKHRSVQAKLAEWLKEQSQSQKERQSGAKRPARGYAQHLAVLCKQLKETPLESNDLADCIFRLTEKESEGTQRDLGGFSTRRAAKFTVMFSKEEILKHHATFLSNAKPAVFQIDLNDPLSNPALMQELQRQLDGLQSPSQQVPEQVREQQLHKAELIEQNEQNKSAFWKVHLDYNVDDLLEELL